MDGDGAVRSWVGNASKDETIINLIVIKEGLLGLVNSSINHLSGTGGACTGTATVRKFDSSFLGGIDDENIIGAVDGSINIVFLRDQLDGVSKSGASARSSKRGKGMSRDEGKKKQNSLEHVEILNETESIRYYGQ